jgi:hypothetical protein
MTSYLSADRYNPPLRADDPQILGFFLNLKTLKAHLNGLLLLALKNAPPRIFIGNFSNVYSKGCISLNVGCQISSAFIFGECAIFF